MGYFLKKETMKKKEKYPSHPCFTCNGERKVLVPIENRLMPCLTCGGDGTIGLTVSDIKPLKKKK